MNETTLLAEEQLKDKHYLKSVTQLGDVRPIVANRDIHASSGIKLISSGMRIDSSLYERLLNHKLIPELDQCLATDDIVTGASLAENASRMMQEDKRLALIQSVRSDGQTLPLILKQVPLNPAIAFKLTVMRETQADLFQHSIFVALVGIYIGMQLEMNRNQLIDIATAALLHDIGQMHMDPKLLERGHKMTMAERRHLYVHPVTGSMILNTYPEYRQKVLDAVLQHHERLDGSGYPRGLKAGEIGQFGQIIAVAEIVASRYGGENAESSGLRLETILKLNMRRYGENIVRYLKVFYQEEADPPPCSDDDKQVAKEMMSRISGIFSSWDKAQAEFDPNSPVCKYIYERMMNLKIEIIDAGLDLNVEDKNLFGIEGDSRACLDMRTLLDETLWQLRDILLEIRRRWPSNDAENPAIVHGAVNSWIAEIETML